MTKKTEAPAGQGEGAQVPENSTVSSVNDSESDSGAQGQKHESRSFVPPDPEPWPEQVDGTTLYVFYSSKLNYILRHGTNSTTMYRVEVRQHVIQFDRSVFWCWRHVARVRRFALLRRIQECVGVGQ